MAELKLVIDGPDDLGDPMACTNVVLGVVEALSGVYRLYFEDSFLEKFFKPMLEYEKTSGDDEVRRLREMDSPGFKIMGSTVSESERETMLNIGWIMASSAYCVQSLREKYHSVAAWSFAIEAVRCEGILLGRLSLDTRKNSLTNFSKKGSHARHKENRELKAAVFTWCNDQKVPFKSLESAASKVTKQVPIAHRTAIDWLKEWEKSHSTGTP